MRLLIVSFKPCWRDEAKPGDWLTTGGFPFQIRALSEIFSSTRLVIFAASGPRPGALTPVNGHCLSIRALPEPRAVGLWRKLQLILRLPRDTAVLWREMSRADAVHALIPGDLGAIAMLLALLRRKRLFVRHCGTWGHRGTLADRFLAWLLPRIAGGRNVIFATGGGVAPPSSAHPEVRWIFSTTLSDDEIENLPAAEPWRPGIPFRLVSVGRLTTGKNVGSILDALAGLRDQGHEIVLEVAGDGPARAELEHQCEALRIRESVTFHGNLGHDSVLRLLAHSHVFVFPTRVAEGFPKAVIEAMASGLPVLASPVSVLPWLLADGCGVLLDSTEPQSVAQAIGNLMKSADELAEMAARARERARSFTLERWSEEIRGALESAWEPLGLDDRRSAERQA